MSRRLELSPASTRKVVRALRAKGRKPVRVSTGRWLALCPCCGRLDLVIGPGGPITAAERDEWLEAQPRDLDNLAMPVAKARRVGSATVADDVGEVLAATETDWTAEEDHAR